MNLFWSIFFISYIISIISLIILIFNDKESRNNFKDGEIVDKLFVCGLIFLPFINNLVLLYATSNNLYYYIKKFYKKKQKIKERKQKIKLGIIKITPCDPYGEENWD
jgi:hypothetical protein